jgi:hypothetical protein
VDRQAAYHRQSLRARVKCCKPVQEPFKAMGINPTIAFEYDLWRLRTSASCARQQGPERYLYNIVVTWTLRQQKCSSPSGSAE